jgi:hypothetical protein
VVSLLIKFLNVLMISVEESRTQTMLIKIFTSKLYSKNNEIMFSVTVPVFLKFRNNYLNIIFIFTIYFENF